MARKFINRTDEVVPKDELSYITRLGPKIEIKDVGTDNTESCDYPLYAQKVAEEVLKNPGSRGLLICGPGEGM